MFLTMQSCYKTKTTNKKGLSPLIVSVKDYYTQECVKCKGVRSLNKDTKKELIKEALKEFRLEEQKIRKNRIYQNTELLLKHYKELQHHADKAVYTLGQMIRENQEIIVDRNGIEDARSFNYEEVYIDSILKSKIRTAIMVQHIDMALEELFQTARNQDKLNKYNTLVDLYFGETNYTYEEIAVRNNCTQMTVRRWRDEMINNLSILLFGAETLVLLA